jgi:hypothetical protein
MAAEIFGFVCHQPLNKKTGAEMAPGFITHIEVLINTR